MKTRVKKWIDGDSGWLSNGNQFRLARHGAPESYQYGHEKATRQAAGMTGRTNGIVNIKPVARDTRGRLVVEMWNKDGSINDRLIQKGKKYRGR